MKGELDRFLELVLLHGPRKILREKARHRKSVRFVVIPPLQDEPLRLETNLPPGALIENFEPARYQPELVREGDASYWLWSGIAGNEMVVDVPRECFNLKTGMIDGNKARVYVTRENGKMMAKVWVMEEVMGTGLTTNTL